MTGDLLEIDNLSVTFSTSDGVVRAADEVSLTVRAGEIFCLVGESGSGKSVVCRTVLGLTRAANARCHGAIRLDGQELLTASERALQRIRGARIGLIPQDPMTAMNPVQRVGRQIAEQIRAHESGVSARAAKDRAVELMTRVGIPQAPARALAYPHELSGGMRQRVLIAMALSCSPRLLIADEPTTALDVSIQAQILAELGQLCRQTGVALLLVTHDFGVVAQMADRVAVMYAGRVVEEAEVTQLFSDPLHPYTWGLLGSVPRLDRPRSARLPAIAGSAPSVLRPSGECDFAPRCPHRFAACASVPPLAASVPEEPGHRDRCWLPLAGKRELRGPAGAIGLFPVPACDQGGIG
jgi:peptide/nickel transport system ATP-binding protein